VLADRRIRVASARTVAIPGSDHRGVLTEPRPARGLALPPCCASPDGSLAILLAVQLIAVLVYPFLEQGEVGRALFSVFGIAILGLVVLAVRKTPGLTWVALLLGGPATVLLLIQAITDSDDLLPYSSALEAVLYFYAAGALIAYMLEDHVITRDELYAVGRRSRSSPGRSPTRTRSCRRSTPAASRRRSTPRSSAPGWSCCSSPSPRSPAPA
jgi:hypothetical protein